MPLDTAGYHRVPKIACHIDESCWAFFWLPMMFKSKTENHGSWVNSYLQLGSSNTAWVICLGPSKSSTLFVGEFPHVWFLSGIIFFVIIFKLMFGGLYLHLSVRHISICVLMCVAYPLFVLCNYHLAHYNSHFSWGLEEEVNIRSLVGHKSKMISTC